MKDTKRKFLIVDSSVAVKWLTEHNEDLIKQADKVLEKAGKDGVLLIMPELAKYEIGNALIFKGLELPFLQTLIDDFHHLPIKFVSEDLSTALQSAELAIEHNITYYDAAFIALALKLKADLVTDNPKHQKKKIAGLKVISLKDYR